ncbi:MAG: HAD family phosphatase [Cyclobacteriaceae bacterium]
MIELSKIDTIIFDLGGVIVDLNPGAVIEKLSKHAGVDLGPMDKMKEFIVSSPILIQYETGKSSEEQFLTDMNELLKANMSMEEFEEAWNLMLGNIPEKRLNLMRSLGQNFNTMILSNTNGIHERKFDEMVNEATGEEGMHSFVHLAHYSHRIGLRKPEASCYNYVIDHSQLKPERTLFLDDNRANITSAQSLGIQAVQVKYPDQIFQITNHG